MTRAARRAEPGAARRSRVPRGVDRRRIVLRRRIAALVGAVLLLGGLAASTWALLYHSGIADVAGVEISGQSSIAEQDLLDAAAVPTGVPLAGIDTAAIAGRIARLPGVASVDVSRRWPDTVVITVVERVPVALATTDLGLTLVDDTGVGYRVAPDPAPPLPRLGFGGIGPEDPATRSALAVLAALPAELRAQVQTVDVVPAPGVSAPAVRLGLTDHREVVFGTAERAADKAAVLGPLLGQPGTVYDVTSPELPTIRR